MNQAKIIDKLSAHNLTSKSASLNATLSKITTDDVKKCIQDKFSGFSLNKLITLLSPAAEEELEKLAITAKEITLQRFGKTMQLYAPLYLSSYCINKCLYCGFNTTHKISRKRLSIDEAVSEAETIYDLGFRDLLLVSGEDKSHISIEYLEKLTNILRNKFSTISIEIYPMNRDEYKRLFNAGVDGVTLYQETYDKKIYEKFHQGGPKSSYEKRLFFQEEAAISGMRRLGLGSLLGLSDWRFECLAMGVHAEYLMKKYWQAKVSFSFPRIKSAENVTPDGFETVTDKSLVQMITALRICFPDAGLTLSTREDEIFRNQVIHLGITQMSAESKTSPGGYTEESNSEQQFTISDRRSASSVAAFLNQSGFEPVWKDWDSSFL